MDNHRLRQQIQPPTSKKDFSKIGTTDDAESCAHTVIMKDMCCICGKNLRPKGGFSGERTEQTTANVSMIHHVPELVVSKEIADELGARDHENIIRQRKLILLLDLDQTLIHTSNRPLRPEEVGAPNLVAYRLGGCTFYTKIRPHVPAFLEHLNSLYEMHIVTFGQRLYAHKIAELLDPNRKYFDYRILSRDELLSSMHKTGNLKALFPCSEQLILMLDDRPDVWMHSEGLIRIKPYRFFTEVGDINAPPQEFLDEPTETVIPPPPIQNLEIEEGKNQSDEKKLEKEQKEEGKDEQKEGGGNEKKEEKEAEMVREKPNDQNKKNGPKIEMSGNELTDPVTPFIDDDNAIEHVERVLVEIHSMFYQHYERDKKLPDVKKIVNWIRSLVLSGERIVFSGIVPLGVDIRACEIYRLCTQFGAKVDERVVQNRTTVLVAARAATEEYRLARRFGIPVVTTRWLDCCFERWRRLDKRDFLFREDEEQILPEGRKFSSKQLPIGKGAEGMKRRRSEEEDDEEQREGPSGELSEDAEPVKRHRLSSVTLCLDEEMDHFAQMDTLSMKALHEMEDEVESALSEDNEEEGEDEGSDADSKSSSSANYSGIEEENDNDKLPSTSGQSQIKPINERGLRKVKFGTENDDDEDDRHYPAEDENEDQDDESKEFTDYGDDETTRDADLDDEEDNLYDEMADDLEVQLKEGTKRTDERDDEEDAR